MQNFHFSLSGSSQKDPTYLNRKNLIFHKLDFRIATIVLNYPHVLNCHNVEMPIIENAIKICMSTGIKFRFSRTSRHSPEVTWLSLSCIFSSDTDPVYAGLTIKSIINII